MTKASLHTRAWMSQIHGLDRRWTMIQKHDHTWAHEQIFENKQNRKSNNNGAYIYICTLCK